MPSARRRAPRVIIGVVNARFHAPGAYAPGDVVTLPAEEAQHLARVLRLHAGDRVRVFNGRGSEFEATLEAVTRSSASARIDAPAASAPEPRVAVTLVQAVLKGDKMDDVVRDAVMLGAAVIQPIVTKRSEISLASLARGNRVDRWARVAVASAKQCGRAVVAAIQEPLAFEDLPDAIDGLRVPSPALMLIEPSATGGATPLAEFDATPPREASVIVGPEGGWDPSEIARASRACHLLSLGRRTVRADAMALVALTALFTHWKEF